MPNFATRQLIVLTAASAAAALFMLTGCQSVSVPPGFARVGAVLQNQTSDVASPSAVYSLMAWYAEANAQQQIPAEWEQFVNTSRTKAQEELDLQWRARIIDNGKGLATASDAGFLMFVPETIAKRQDWEAVLALVHNLKVLVSAQNTVTIPKEECLSMSFWDKQAPQKLAFSQWADLKKTLTLPDHPQLRRLDLIRQLDAMHTAIILKRNILDICRDAEQLIARHQFTPALDTLGKLKAELVEKQQNLDAIRDQETLTNLDRQLQHLPELAISTHLQKLRDIFLEVQKTTDPFAALEAAERQLTALLHEWHTDARYQDARLKLIAQLRQTLDDAAQARTQLWKQRIDTLVAQKRFWDAALLARTNLEQIASPTHPQFGAYSQLLSASDTTTHVVKFLENHLRAQIAQFLPQALQYFNDKAVKSHQQGKPGFAVALGRMGDAICTLAGAQPSPDSDTLARALQATTQKALVDITENYLKRNVSIADMTSSIPGSGLIYTRDLMHALQDMIDERKLDNLITITPAVTNEPSSANAYSLFNGVVADFNGNETAERLNKRRLIRYGAPRMTPNPKAAGNPEIPPNIYTQEISEQIINIREIERIAHVRVFITMRGPDFTSLVELNEFYKRQFVIEESHPFNDLRVIDVLQTDDLSKLRPQDDEPNLRYDRIWTPGEILDWARKDSLKILTLKILFHLNQYPLMLANKARHFAQNGNLVEATETWTACAELMKLLDPGKLVIIGLDQTAHSVAKGYENCIAELQKQYADLNELARNVQREMTTVANKLLQRD